MIGPTIEDNTVIKTLSDAIEARGYDTLTPVQEAVTQAELGDADLLVSAQTGSGKTVGFGLAIAPTVLGEAERFEKANKPLALIIAPTRELALQVKRELEWLYAKAGATIASCVGGMDMRDERRALERGAHIVVGTPGRLRDHIGRRSLNMNALRAVVLDEADEMLDLGFREDLEMILGEAPEDRRTLMFSATVPRSIATLAQHYQKDAVRVTTKAEASQHSDIEYRAMNVAARDGENAIINVLRFYESPTAIVFCNTRAMVNRLTTRFSNRGFSVVALSGELSQNERTHALQAMRDGRARVCIATDVAARGIDLPNLELVIHAELPSSHETMLHRSGRTGRAGRKGVSALIVPPKSRRKAERILKSAKVTAEWSDAPSADAVIARDEERLMNDPTWQQEISEKELSGAQKLAELYSVEHIAAAYLRLYNSRQSAPEELGASGSDGAPQKRAAFGASVWFSLAGGRKDNAEARRILPMICKAGGITKDDVGAIRVQQHETFIEIRKSSVDTFVKAMGPDMRAEEGGTLIQLDRAPKIAASPRPNSGGKKRDYKSKDGGKGNPRPKSNARSDKDYWDHNSGQEPSKKRPKGGSKAKPFTKKPEDDLLGDGAVKRLKRTTDARKAKGKSKAAIAKGKKKKAKKKAERSK